MTAPRPDPRASPGAASSDPAAAAPRRLGPVQYLWVAGAVLVFAALLHWLGPVLTPFLIAAILAYFGSPAVTWAERHRVPRTMGTLLAMLVILALLLGLMFVLIPLVQSEITQVIRRLPELVGQLNARVAPWLRDTLGIELQLDLATVKQLISENLESAETVTLKVLSSIKAGGTVVLGILINLALIPVVILGLLFLVSRRV